MARVRLEAKPTWRQVPAAVRERTEAALSARVTRASRAWGGYSPTPTFRLLLAVGRRAFVKAASPESTAFARVEFDAAAFAQTVPIEGGPGEEQVMAWYADSWPVDRAALDASVASIAGHFANHAWAPELPDLPRVRTFQRQQLAVTLRWAARRLRLPDPDWIAAIPGVR